MYSSPSDPNLKVTRTLLLLYLLKDFQNLLMAWSTRVQNY